ncbi:RHS repeat-associated core domain-containing protein [Pseudomonas moraviensis]|uniref:RHS repeat-associated core domain-containing protein n=1 Tax=Pseudomonas moraviensis TaxID=321662 RepID=UPI0022C63D23|nr:RHS repeat-associated core domain-containing protein [Pseudomonas moraviensis]GLH39140.1 type IV secretion protein Rhs [Pseudomonas moraviensis]
MDRVAFVDNQLNTFKDSLKLYQEQTKTWYAQALDKGSRAADMPSLLGMERVIKVGNTSKAVSMTDGNFTSNVAQCPLKGPLLIESKFESVYDIPVGDIEVEIVAVDGGAVSKVKLDAQGKAAWNGGVPGKFYKIRVHNVVTPAQIDALFSSYSGVTADLEGFLRKEWVGFKPQWSNLSTSGTAMAIGNGILEGGWEAIKGVWDGISLVLDILQDPGKFAKDLGAGADELIKVAKSTPDVMKKAMLLASDEAALFLLVRSAVIWLAALPPMKMAGDVAKITTAIVVGIAIDIVIGVVLTVAAEGTGVIYLAARLKKYGELVIKAVIGFVKSVFKIINGFMEYVAKYTAVAARGVTAKVRNGISELRFDGKRVTTVETPKTRHDAPAQSKTPDEKSATCAKNTCTNGCPVSMVTGEELLTLTDGELGGPAPFSWTRLYRTSAAEIDCGLGFGWSHALAQRIEINADEVVWTDHENRVITFPLPSIQRPAITNSLSEAAIFIGDDPSELILTQAGEHAQFYHFRYDRKGATLIAISDKYDNRLHVTRDIHGRIKRIDNGAGRALLLRYDRKHIVAVDYQQFTPADNLEDVWTTVQTIISYAYDSQHRLIEAKNAAGEAERYAYNDQNVILERRLAGGASFYWEWEKEGKSARCIHHWANFSQMDTRYVWDDKGSVTVTNADGSEEIYTHDDQARLVAQIDPDGAENLKAYDDKGRLVAEQNPLGAITEYRYNESGHLVAVIPPEDEPTGYEYSRGFVSKVVRGKAVWKYQRNNQGDITQQTDPDGNTTYYSYDRRGRLQEIGLPDGSRHQLGWNSLGQLLEERLPDGSQRKYRYDALGRQITRQDENGAITHFQWDAANRLAQITLPGGATRAFTYNAYGRVTAERDELGRITRYEYADNLHLVSRRINPDGSQLRYRYDNSRLLLTEIENERGEHYHLNYYANGLIQQETGFDGRRTAYEYDLNGQLLKKTEFGDDGSELVTEYQRDAAGRLLVKTLPDGEEIHYSYDALGRLVNVDDGHWPLAYKYDLQDRLIEEHQGWGTLRYEYDSIGQLKHCRLPDGSKLDYRHQPGGQLSSIDLNGSRLTSHQFSAGREQQRQQGLLLSQYQYDEQGRLQAHSVSQRDKHLFQRRYNYDANGNLAGIDDSRKGNRSYHYDPLDRLISVRGAMPESFAHDPAGNLLGQNDLPVANLANVKGNRLLMQGDRHYDYDAYGNLIRESRGTGQKLVTEYRYDCQHRLIGVSLPGGSTASYKYDAFGRRIEKTVDGHTIEFLWQGERLIAENGENRYRSYIYEPGSFRPLAMLDGEGPLRAAPFYYQLDHLGTPQELTDYSGEIMWSAKYRAYGNLAALDVSEIDNPLRFQGQYFDAETGLHYNRHRYYNPGTGRFLTPDPIKLAGGLNSYQYVPNPTGWVDPLGLSCKLGQCPEPPKWSEKSVFNKYPEKTVLRTSGPEAQAAFLQEHLPGLPKEQAQMILEESYKKGTSVVIGGSRVRGDNHIGSDLDVGFGDINANKAGKLVKGLEKKFEGKEGFLSLEQTRITPGNKTQNIEEIKSPEEFFQRSGTRSGQDQRAGEQYRASGSITLREDGTITLIPPGATP